MQKGRSQERKKLNNKKQLARAGEFWTVNDFITKGHKSRISKRYKNGTVDVVTITHAKRTFNRKNIPLSQNPDKNDNLQANVVRKKHNTNIGNLGKRQIDVVVTNKQDKSIFRHIGK